MGACRGAMRGKVEGTGVHLGCVCNGRQRGKVGTRCRREASERVRWRDNIFSAVHLVHHT